MKRLVRFVCCEIKYARLGTKMFALILFAVFFPLIASLFMFNNYVTNTVYSSVRQTAANTFSQLYDIFNGNFESIRRNILPLQLDTNSRALLLEYERQSAAAQAKAKTHVTSLVTFVENRAVWDMQLRIYAGKAGSFFIDRQYFFPFDEAGQADWYTFLVSRPHKNMWFYNANNANAFLYVVRVCDPARYGATTAILTLSFSESPVRDTLRQSMLMLDGARVFLTDEAGRALTCAQVGSGTIPPLTDVPGWQYSAVTWSDLVWEGTRYHVQSRSFANNPWRLVMMTPYANTFRTLLNDRQWLTLLILAFLCGVCIFGIAARFSGRVSHRVGLVTERMSNLKNGALVPLPPSVDGDELGTLIESYNYLADELSMLTTARNLAADNQKNAELNVLRAQINPHFLYNTLEMINYFAYERKPEEVERIVSLLSRFYKLCLNLGSEMSTLETEIELTNAYWNIQNMRCHGKITLETDIPSEIFVCAIPHLILQPIVENAIKHGIWGKPGQTGVIRVTATREGENVALTVTDDGAGMPIEKLRQLSKGLQLAGDMSVNGSHYGLKNIHERLIRYYGAGCGLSFQSEPGVGTTVTVRFAANKNRT